MGKDEDKDNDLNEIIKKRLELQKQIDAKKLEIEEGLDRLQSFSLGVEETLRKRTIESFVGILRKHRDKFVILDEWYVFRDPNNTFKEGVMHLDASADYKVYMALCFKVSFSDIQINSVIMDVEGKLTIESSNPAYQQVVDLLKQ